MSENFVYGLHAVTALLGNRHRKIHQLFITEERKDKRFQNLLEMAIRSQVNIETLSNAQMNQRFAEAAHQGIVASVAPLPDYAESDLEHLLENSKSPCLILILDGVTDPHNLGACLRTADASGVDFVIIPKDKSATITPVVAKVACGAVETIPVVRATNLVRAIEALKQRGVWVYGAAGEACDSVYRMDWKSSIAVVMGAEGSGMRRLTRDHCDGLFSIPMLGSVSSLNVSVATGVTLYEVVRQRVAIS